MGLAGPLKIVKERTSEAAFAETNRVKPITDLKTHAQRTTPEDAQNPLSHS
jgi:hypothetical protein